MAKRMEWMVARAPASPTLCKNMLFALPSRALPSICMRWISTNSSVRQKCARRECILHCSRQRHEKSRTIHHSLYLYIELPWNDDVEKWVATAVHLHSVMQNQQNDEIHGEEAEGTPMKWNPKKNINKSWEISRSRLRPEEKVKKHTHRLNWMKMKKIYIYRE